MAKKEAKLWSLAEGHLLIDKWECAKKKDAAQEDSLLPFSQWETSKEARDVNFPGEEEYEVRFLSSNPQKAKHCVLLGFLFF